MRSSNIGREHPGVEATWGASRSSGPREACGGAAPCEAKRKAESAADPGRLGGRNVHGGGAERRPDPAWRTCGVVTPIGTGISSGMERLLGATSSMCCLVPPPYGGGRGPDCGWIPLRDRAQPTVGPVLILQWGGRGNNLNNHGRFQLAAGGWDPPWCGRRKQEAGWIGRPWRRSGNNRRFCSSSSLRVPHRWTRSPASDRTMRHVLRASQQAARRSNGRTAASTLRVSPFARGFSPGQRRAEPATGDALHASPSRSDAAFRGMEEDMGLGRGLKGLSWFRKGRGHTPPFSGGAVAAMRETERYADPRRQLALGVWYPCLDWTRASPWALLSRPTSPTLIARDLSQNT